MLTKLFTRAEAAVLAQMPTRVVEKAIEDGVIEVHKAAAYGSARKRRLLSAEGVYYIVLLKKCEVHFSKDVKLRLWKHFKSTSSDRLLAVEWKLSPGFKIKPGDVLRPTVKRVSRYSKARDRWIRVDENIKGGTPVIRGTRMSVYSIAGRVAHGETIDDILSENLDLKREALETAVAYANANPLVGRPGGRPWQA
jgi:uncharacterized protein (DUF433 family)